MRIKIIITIIIWQMVFLTNALSAPINTNPPLINKNDHSWEGWQLTVMKSITYPFFTSVDDISSVYYLTGNVANSVALGFFLSTSKLMIYGVHEYTWNTFAPMRKNEDKLMHAIYKSITYRLASMTFVFSASLLYTETIASAMLFTLINAAYGTTFYFAHEMLWNYLGPVVRTE